MSVSIKLTKNTMIAIFHLRLEWKWLQWEQRVGFESNKKIYK